MTAVEIVEIGTLGGASEIIEVANVSGPPGPQGPQGVAGTIGLDPIGVQLSNVTLSASSQFVPVDTTNQNVTITFPTAPPDRTTIGARHITQGGTNIVTLAAGGTDKFNKPGAVAPTYLLSLVNQAAVFTYDSVQAVWYPHSQSLGLATMDGRYAATNRGMPAGGTATQVLAKNSATDYDGSWQDAAAGGGGGAPTGAAGGSLAGTYPNPTLAVNSVGSNQIIDGAVATTDMANMAQNTIMGRVSAGAGPPSNLSATQVATVLATGSGGGTTNYLSAAGTWTAPSVSLAVTSIKTGAYTVAANELVRANTSGGAFTFTLPSAPVAGTMCGVILVTAGNALTVQRGGTDVFDRAGGPTTMLLYNAGDMLLAEYSSDGVWLVSVRPAPALNDGTYTYLDTGTPGVVKTQLNDEIGASSLILLDSNVKMLSADYMANSPLPTCTYASGTLGVGATLTGNALAALTVIDGITPALNDTIMVLGQAACAQNGLYNVTAVGSGSASWVLTRDINLDQAADLANGVIVQIAKGGIHAGRRVRLRAMSYIMGTTGINGLSGVTVGDIFAGPVRDREPIIEEFGSFSATTTMTAATGLHVAGVRGTFYGSGAAGEQMSQFDGTVAGGDTVDGIARMETGTTATGRVCYTSHGAAFFDQYRYWWVYVRFKVPTVSDGTNTFNVKLGIMDTLDGAPANGIYFEAISGTANWQAVTRVAGVSTNIDTGQAYNTAFRNFAVILPGDGNAYFWNGGAIVATVTSGFPATSASMYPAMAITKSVGTTSRELRLDLIGVDIPTVARANLLLP